MAAAKGIDAQLSLSLPSNLMQKTDVIVLKLVLIFWKVEGFLSQYYAYETY